LVFFFFKKGEEKKESPERKPQEEATIKTPAVLIVDSSNLYNAVKEFTGETDEITLVDAVTEVLTKFTRYKKDLDVLYFRLVVKKNNEGIKKFWDGVKRRMVDRLKSRAFVEPVYLEEGGFSVDDVHLIGEVVAWGTKMAVDDESAELEKFKRNKQETKILDLKADILARLRKRNEYAVCVLTGDVGLINRLKTVKEKLFPERALYFSRVNVQKSKKDRKPSFEEIH